MLRKEIQIQEKEKELKDLQKFQVKNEIMKQ